MVSERPVLGGKPDNVETSCPVAAEYILIDDPATEKK